MDTMNRDWLLEHPEQIRRYPDDRLAEAIADVDPEDGDLSALLSQEIARRAEPGFRYAQCASCKAIVPSDPSLPFFEDRSPGTQDDRCSVCRYGEKAHGERDGKRHRVAGTHDFVPMTEGYEYDSWYSGCRGWS